VEERERDGAERDAVREVRCAVDGVEGPDPLGAGFAGSSLFLAEEPDAGRLGLQVGADGALDGQVDIGDQVAVGFLGDFP